MYLFSFLSGMTKIEVYYDGVFNDLNNYISYYSKSKVLVYEHMSFQELHNILLSKLGNFVDMDNLNIYIYLSFIECLKKNLPITNDGDVK